VTGTRPLDHLWRALPGELLCADDAPPMPSLPALEAARDRHCVQVADHGTDIEHRARRQNLAVSVSALMGPPIDPETGDPWIDAYLAFRAAVLAGEFETIAQAEEFARELKRALPSTAPSVPAATFITADIGITFSESSCAAPSPIAREIRHVMVGLWKPDFAR
jgi:hypothetical protein